MTITPDRAGRDLTPDLHRVSLPRLLPRLVFEVSHQMAGRLRHLRPGSELDLAQLQPPESRLTQSGSRLAAQVLPPYLLNHSVRSYLFAAAIAEHEHIGVDRELLFLGALLHDIGLVETFDGPRAFEVQGARTARAFLVAEGLEPARADIVHEAIALHTSLGRTIGRVPEISLVHRGTGVDLLGIGRRAVHPSTRAAILQAHPRHEFTARFADALRDQTDRKPQSHIAGDVDRGLLRLIAAAPYDD